MNLCCDLALWWLVSLCQPLQEHCTACMQGEHVPAHLCTGSSDAFRALVPGQSTHPHSVFVQDVLPCAIVGDAGIGA